jgi:hypothetical protein
VADEEERDTNEMDECAQQDLKTVQGKDGVANSLFKRRVWDGCQARDDGRL